MWRLAIPLLVCSIGPDADKEASDPWDKLTNIKSGSDLRIYRKGAAEFTAAKSAYVTERKVVVIIKNTETAIDKNEIDRVESRPPAGKPAQTKTYENTPDSASMSISRSTTREGWTTIYTRTPTK
jgi:hypothetical protein